MDELDVMENEALNAAMLQCDMEAEQIRSAYQSELDKTFTYDNTIDLSGRICSVDNNPYKSVPVNV